MTTTVLGLTLPTVGGSADTWGTENNTALTAIDAGVMPLTGRNQAGAAVPMTGVLVGATPAAGANGYASFRLPTGSAPTTNLTAGDFWIAGNLPFLRLGSTTRQLATLDGTETLSNKTLSSPVITFAAFSTTSGFLDDLAPSTPTTLFDAGSTPGDSYIITAGGSGGLHAVVVVDNAGVPKIISQTPLVVTYTITISISGTNVRLSHNHSDVADIQWKALKIA